jgi:hypothetical protein
MKKVLILLALSSGFVLAEEKRLSLEQIHEAIVRLTEPESKPYHVISNVEVYDYYSRTLGRHK